MSKLCLILMFFTLTIPMYAKDLVLETVGLDNNSKVLKEALEKIYNSVTILKENEKPNPKKDYIFVGFDSDESGSVYQIVMAGPKGEGEKDTEVNEVMYYGYVDSYVAFTTSPKKLEVDSIVAILKPAISQ